MDGARKILLVDDEPRNLVALEAILEPLGHRLLRANGGQEALRLFGRERPDLVLLDLRMPEVDGLAVLRGIRDGENGRYVPVVLLTADGEREQRLRGLEAGADEFLEKPIDPALLVARVRTLLRLKEALDAIARRNDELVRLHAAQRELAEFIVHDLKNPITVAEMNLDWAISELRDATETVREGLGDAREAIVRLRALVEDLLVVSRLEQASVPLQREPVVVSELLDDVARAHAREAAEKRIAVSVRVEDGLRVSGDPAILRRLVENVLENALRHTPAEGRIALSARGGASVEIAIANTGRAIPVVERARIFERRTRGEEAEPSSRHAGLGLYFCRRAAEVHGGEIHVVEDDEWPTRFVVRLPGS